MRIVLFEAFPRDPGSGVVTVRAATAQGDPAGVYLGGFQWLPAISRAPTITVNLASLSLTGELEVAYSDLELRLGGSLGTNAWSRYVWDGAPCQLWIGELGQPFSAFVSVLKGRCGPMRRPQAPTGVLSLRGPEGDLDKPVLTSTYSGSGGMEGDAGLKGVLRPWCSGRCEGVSGVLLNRTYWIWQVHGYGPVQAVTAVYEQGLSLGASSGNYATYTALRDAPLAEGEWATCHALGLARIGAQPTGRVVFDVEGALDGPNYYDRAPQIAGHIMRHVGVPPAQVSGASISAAVAAFNQPYGLYIDVQVQAMSVVRKAMSDVYGYAMADGLGVWRFGRFATGKTPTVLRRDRSALPLVQRVSQDASASPVGRVAVGARRCWTVHNESEISPALLDLINGVATLQQARPWLSGDAQEVGQVVTYQGRTFQAAVASVGVEPPTTGTSSPEWTLIADKGEDGQDGEDGQSAGLIYRRSSAQPATPSPGTGTPSGWYEATGDVPAGPDPVWASPWTRANSGANRVYQTPTIFQSLSVAVGSQVVAIPFLGTSASIEIALTGTESRQCRGDFNTTALSAAATINLHMERSLKGSGTWADFGSSPATESYGASEPVSLEVEGLITASGGPEVWLVRWRTTRTSGIGSATPLEGQTFGRA